MLAPDGPFWFPSGDVLGKTATSFSHSYIQILWSSSLFIFSPVPPHLPSLLSYFLKVSVKRLASGTDKEYGPWPPLPHHKFKGFITVLTTVINHYLYPCLLWQGVNSRTGIPGSYFLYPMLMGSHGTDILSWCDIIISGKEKKEGEMMEGREEQRKEVECIHSNLKTIPPKEILLLYALFLTF